MGQKIRVRNIITNIDCYSMTYVAFVIGYDNVTLDFEIGIFAAIIRYLEIIYYVFLFSLRLLLLVVLMMMQKICCHNLYCGKISYKSYIIRKFIRVRKHFPRIQNLLLFREKSSFHYPFSCS